MSLIYTAFSKSAQLYIWFIMGLFSITQSSVTATSLANLRQETANSDKGQQEARNFDRTEIAEQLTTRQRGQLNQNSLNGALARTSAATGQTLLSAQAGASLANGSSNVLTQSAGSGSVLGVAQGGGSKASQLFSA